MMNQKATGTSRKEIDHNGLENEYKCHMLSTMAKRLEG